MTRVAVIIPFYQRQPGLLSRALRSVEAQVLDASVRLDVVVVDDGSPARVQPELAGVGAGLREVVRVVGRPNGGAAKARNTGLDALSGSAEAVAFLDSDDAWRPLHLARGLHALTAGADFYFANCQTTDGEDWFATRDFDAAKVALLTGGLDGQHAWSSDDALAVLSATYVSPTPSVIYRLEPHRRQRFDERLQGAGEDHLFWLGLAAKSRLCAFSTEIEVDVGRGLNAHLSVDTWSHPQAATLHFDQLLFCNTALIAYGERLRGPHAWAFQRLRADRERYRRLTMRLIMVRFARTGRLSPSLLRRIARQDPACLLAAPAASWRILRRRADPPPRAQPAGGAF